MDVSLLRDVPLSAYLTFFGIMAAILFLTLSFNHSDENDELERLIDEFRMRKYL
jgi:hypothetical protein